MRISVKDKSNSGLAVAVKKIAPVLKQLPIKAIEAKKTLTNAERRGPALKALFRPENPRRPLSFGFKLMLVTAVLLTGVAFKRYVLTDSNPIPETIQEQIPFSPFVVPRNAPGFTTSNYLLSPVEGGEQVLSYVVRDKAGNAISVSVYPQSEEFEEIPEYKERFLTNQVQKYDTVQTSNGSIHLGRSPKQNNRQFGIMLERGLVVFFNPEKELTAAEWRNLGDHLEIQKVTN